jgi:hypothetical protein
VPKAKATNAPVTIAASDPHRADRVSASGITRSPTNSIGSQRDHQALGYEGAIQLVDN